MSTACLASKSVIEDGRNMKVFSHEVNCCSVLLKIHRCSTVELPERRLLDTKTETGKRS